MLSHPRSSWQPSNNSSSPAHPHTSISQSSVLTGGVCFGGSCSRPTPISRHRGRGSAKSCRAPLTSRLGGSPGWSYAPLSSSSR
eukprot:3889939-Lingulodinium_polyedra.AAC.1